MTSEEKKAVFIDLYELYQEGELEEETVNWMKEHEPLFQSQAEAAAVENRKLPGIQKADDRQQLRHIKVFVYSLYGSFLLLSIWMTVWFFLIEELYREYYHDIMYYLYRRTHQLETAKDLAQDTFLKAFAGLESFRGHSSIKTWLYTIAHHTFINWYRKDKKIQFSDVTACGDMEQHTFEMPERHLANAIRQEELRHHINRLKEHYQTVLILREFQELSYEEIAEVLNWKLSKVKTNLHRARLELRKSLEGREV